MLCHKVSVLFMLAACAGAAPEPTTLPTSWIGNTFGGADGHWVQNNIATLFVAPDGTCYTNSFWDEGAHEAGIYKDGGVGGACDDAHGHGGFAVAADSVHLFIVYHRKIQKSDKTDTWGIRRYDLAGHPAPFSDGAWDGSFRRITSSPTALRGMCIAGKEIFVSDFDANIVRVFSLEAMTPLRTFALPRPMRLCAGANGNLWIIQSKTADQAAKIVHVTPAGDLLPQSITDSADLVAVAVDGRGRLLVADNGPDQQVRIYDQIATAPKLVGTLGEKGGIFSGRIGQTGPLRFNGLTGVGADAAGNVYVSFNNLGPYFADHPGYGANLECFAADGAAWKLKWQLQGLEFVAGAEVDPGSENDVFTQNQHFVLDLSRPAGQQWTLAGQTLDARAYPDDVRAHASCECVLGVRRLQGKRLLYLTNMYASVVAVFRWDEGNERFIPSGVIAREPFKNEQGEMGAWPPRQPPGDWIWRDANGDGRFDADEYDPHQGDNSFVWGWSVDSQGTIWKALRENGIRRFPLEGFDVHGNPKYSYRASVVIPNPPPFITTPVFKGDINRIEYDAAGDVMYLAGYTPEHPNKPSKWGQVGPVICRYDHWSKLTGQKTWEINPPYDPAAGVTGKAMSIAGDYLFLSYMQQPKILIYELGSGKQVGTLAPGPEVGHVGWTDLPYGVKAFRRADGEYVILNEEVVHGKILMYRWKP